MKVKIKKVLQICKQAGDFRLINEPGGIQWLGDGATAYPLYDNPFYSEKTFAAAFDLAEAEEKKVRTVNDPRGLDLSDTTADESPVFREEMTIRYKGHELVALHTKSGIVFIQARYLSPFSGDEVELYERRTDSGNTYIAVKVGFVIAGVIAPVDVYNDRNFLPSLRRLCAEAEKGQQLYGNATDEAEEEQIKLNDDGEV